MTIPTVVQYGDETLEFCTIQDWRTETVYDSANLQAAYFRHQVTIQSLIRNPTPSLFTERVNVLQQSLNTPRQRLVIKAGTLLLADINPAFTSSGNTDAYGGPRPTSLSMTRVKGGRAASIVWVVEYHVPVSPNIAAILTGHRWTQRFDINAVGDQRRVVEGVLETSSSGSLADINPDLFREHVFPPLVAGFKRERQEYVIEASGRQMRYLIEDVQQFRAVPYPALKASATYKANIQPGGIVEKTFSITLQGRKPATSSAQDPNSQQNLLARAWSIMETRINTGNDGDYVMAAEITEDLFANRVGLVVISKGAAGDNATEIANPDVWRLFMQIETGNPTGVQQNEPGPYGSALIRAVEAHLFNQTSEGVPTSPDSVIPAQVTGIAAEDPDVPSEITVVPNGSLPQDLTLSRDPGVLSATQGTTNYYTEVAMWTDQIVNNRLIEIPLADSNVASAVQQMGGPVVIETYGGYMERMDAPPVVPDIPGLLAGSDRRGLIMHAKTVPVAPKAEADGAHRRYGVRYEVRVMVPYNPSISGFEQQSGGVYGTFDTYVDSGIAQPDNPMLSAGSAPQGGAGTGI